ncbi:hypothetical protein AVEN_223037-1 [Araneus ventricosus]|uniref:Uncharacterized protein n=1 Tax=Araneus ventricosus TaxID=182803 RepID=A0A4Y2H9U1_ARAVE|nr:hypothetical protein AVEN_223037-1 [Araneus ventricosus]
MCALNEDVFYRHSTATVWANRSWLTQQKMMMGKSVERNKKKKKRIYRIVERERKYTVKEKSRAKEVKRDSEREIEVPYSAMEIGVIQEPRRCSPREVVLPRCELSSEDPWSER